MLSLSTGVERINLGSEIFQPARHEQIEGRKPEDRVTLSVALPPEASAGRTKDLARVLRN